MPRTIVETPRLRLREFAADLSDVDALNEIQSDAVHMRYYPHPFTRADTEAWVRSRLQSYADRGFGLWVVEDRETGQLLGNVGPTVQMVDGLEEVELGWSITPRRARQGVATEAAAACRDLCFGELDLEHVIALVRPENTASRRVAEHIGMTVWKQTVFGSEGWTHLVYSVDRGA